MKNLTKLNYAMAYKIFYTSNYIQVHFNSTITKTEVIVIEHKLILIPLKCVCSMLLRRTTQWLLL